MPQKHLTQYSVKKYNNHEKHEVDLETADENDIFLFL